MNNRIVAMGDFVKSTSHGHTGRVYKIEYTDDSWNDWLSLQSIPPTPEQIKGEWIGILINGHGAVSVPEDTCTIIPPIEGFRRQHNDSPFEEDNRDDHCYPPHDIEGVSWTRPPIETLPFEENNGQ